MKLKYRISLIFMICLLIPGGWRLKTLRAGYVEEQGNVSCQQPGLRFGTLCRERGERLLASTVRLEVRSWRVKRSESGYDIQSSIGHATLKDRRYLVTHNHFSIPLAVSGTGRDFVTVSVYDGMGKLLFMRPLDSFKVVVEEEETLVLEVRGEDLQETLARDGVVSADFSAEAVRDLRPGMEVGQVDWDGERTFIHWTEVEEVVMDTGTPRLVLADGIGLGASGGGVFVNGQHLATNWRVDLYLNEATQDLLYETSTAALNTEAVVR